MPRLVLHACKSRRWTENAAAQTTLHDPPTAFYWRIYQAMEFMLFLFLLQASLVPLAGMATMAHTGETTAEPPVASMTNRACQPASGQSRKGCPRTLSYRL